MSARPRHSPSFERRAFLASLSGLAWGCAGSLRMEARFDSNGLGPPVEFPQPTPPDDRMFWSTSRTSSTVMVRPGTGSSTNHWVRITPNPAYAELSSPKRATALMALSEPFTGSLPKIGGELTVSMTGRGTVVFLLSAVQGPSWEGGALVAVAFESSDQSSRIAHLTGAQWSALGSDPQGLPGSTFVANFEPGSLTTIRWFVDQGAHTLELKVDAVEVKPAILQFPSAVSGISLTPIGRVMLSVHLYEASSDLVVFLDDVLIRQR
jgi:hypothetical protein